MPRSILVLLAVGAMAVAACSQTPEGEAATATEPSKTTTTVTDTAPTTAPSTTTGPADPETTVSDRPVAPDFTLVLGDGGTYTLSQGTKPVYLIFWAEW